jgi:hypothetical protein
MFGVLIISARSLGGWISIQRMRRRATPIESRGCRSCLARLTERLAIRRSVALLESEQVHVPSVMGWLRPAILLPFSAMTGMSIQHVEAILAHELAHVRRNDYLVNLIQTAVETLLFYHPAIWWISRQVRNERENCCDDLAVRAIGDVRVYSAALAAMEEIRMIEPALAVSGGSLVERIRRLLKAEPRRRAAIAWPAALITTALILGVALFSQIATPKAAAQNQAPVPPATPAPPALPAPVAQSAPPIAPAPPASDPFGLMPTPGTTVPAVVSPGWDMPIVDDWQIAARNARETEAKLQLQQAELKKRTDELRTQLAQASKEAPNAETTERLRQVLQASEAQLNDARRQEAQAMYSLSSLSRQGVPNAYYISGVVRSGMYPLLNTEPITLEQALRDAGGLAPGSDDKFILIIHQRASDSDKTTRIAVKDLKNNDVNGGGANVGAGDVIVLSDRATPPLPTEGRYMLNGNVPRPGYYPLVRNMTLLQALVAAGVNPPDKPDAMVEVHYGNNAYGSQSRLAYRPGSFPMSDMITGRAGMMGINPDAIITVQEGDKAPTTQQGLIR